MRPAPLNPAVCDTLYRSGWTKQQIADHFGVSEPAVRRCLHKQGTPMRRRGRVGGPAKPEQLNAIIAQRRDGRTFQDIADELGITHQAVQQMLAHHGHAVPCP